MLKVNEYFDGNVKSIAFESEDGPATAGVMALGEYEFGTSSIELMTITSGKMSVLLPGEEKWKSYIRHETFMVPANEKFKVKVEEDCSYLCLFKH